MFASAPMPPQSGFHRDEARDGPGMTTFCRPAASPLTECRRWSGMVIGASAFSRLIRVGIVLATAFVDDRRHLSHPWICQRVRDRAGKPLPPVGVLFHGAGKIDL